MADHARRRPRPRVAARAAPRPRSRTADRRRRNISIRKYHEHDPRRDDVTSVITYHKREQKPARRRRRLARGARVAAPAPWGAGAVAFKANGPPGPARGPARPRRRAWSDDRRCFTLDSSVSDFRHSLRNAALHRPGHAAAGFCTATGSRRTLLDTRHNTPRHTDAEAEHLENTSVLPQPRPACLTSPSGKS